MTPSMLPRGERPPYSFRLQPDNLQQAKAAALLPSWFEMENAVNPTTIRSRPTRSCLTARTASRVKPHDLESLQSRFRHRRSSGVSKAPVSRLPGGANHRQSAEIFPHDLFTADRCDDSSRMWMLMQTEPGRETSLAAELTRLEIPHYLPLLPPDVADGESAAMFVGSIFVYANHEDSRLCSRLKNTSKVIPVYNQERVDQDLRRVFELLQKDRQQQTARMSPGQRVRIKDGLLQGLEGVIVDFAEGCNRWVDIDANASQAAVEIEAHRLELIS